MSQSRKVENMPTYDYAKYHFGFILAVNQMHFVIKPVTDLHKMTFNADQSTDFSGDSAKIYSIQQTPSMGFTVGIVGNLRLGNYFDLRFIPSLSFGERYLDYRILKYRDGESTLIEIKKTIPSTFVEFPLHLKYKSKRVNNFRAYVLTGMNYRVDLASDAKKNKDQAQVLIKLQRGDLSYEIGVGFDFYFEWFKFGTEAKMSYGLSDLLIDEDNIYVNGIESLKSKVFQISLTFE